VLSQLTRLFACGPAWFDHGEGEPPPEPALAVGDKVQIGDCFTGTVLAVFTWKNEQLATFSVRRRKAG
jgi:hypothetical protein